MASSALGPGGAARGQRHSSLPPVDYNGKFVTASDRRRRDVSDQEQPERPPGAGSRPSRGTSLSLLERARDQDAAAWQRLVYLYKPLVLFWCGRSGVRIPDGEDVAQEVFLVVASRLPEFDRTREGSSFRYWLRAIPRNVLLAHWRNGQR